MFFKGKNESNSNNRDQLRDQSKQEVLEIDFLKENRVLQSIIKISYGTKDIASACNEIIRIITQNYNIKYCSLYLTYNNRLKTAGTNVEPDSVLRLEDYINEMYREKCNNNDVDAFVLKSDTPMNYETAWEREIRYMMFSPLKIDKVIGAILIENSELTITKDELEFFELIVENVALILQNLLYFKQIVDAANKDGLTGMYNRHYMNEHLASVINNANQTGENFCIALLDIDHFKNFNDTYGHLHGDKVLKEVSKFIQNEIRAYDVIYRYGGEEFVIYFANSNIELASEILERLRQGVADLSITTEKNEVTKVTASFGVAEFPTHDRSIQGLVEKSDKAMYFSKENGRNRVTKFDMSMMSIKTD